MDRGEEVIPRPGKPVLVEKYVKRKEIQSF
jgi:hypothetical protein